MKILILFLLIGSIAAKGVSLKEYQRQLDIFKKNFDDQHRDIEKLREKLGSQDAFLDKQRSLIQALKNEQQLRMTEIDNLKQTFSTMKGDLSEEKTEREKSDQEEKKSREQSDLQIQGHVDTLENSHIELQNSVFCSEDSDCAEPNQFCFNGWCSIGVPKVFGQWTNEGSCQAVGEDPTCGPGTQDQVRTCSDGTTDKCYDDEKQREIDCAAAGTELPSCYTDPNCTCAGIANEFEEGAICKVYSGYKDWYMNGEWCNAETATCREATEHGTFNNGSIGASRSACQNRKVCMGNSQCESDEFCNVGDFTCHNKACNSNSDCGPDGVCLSEHCYIYVSGELCDGITIRYYSGANSTTNYNTINAVNQAGHDCLKNAKCGCIENPFSNIEGDIYTYTGHSTTGGFTAEAWVKT